MKQEPGTKDQEPNKKKENIMNTRAFTRSLGTLATAAFIFATTSSQAATITYGFDDGSAAAVSDFGSGVTADDVVLGGSKPMRLEEDRAQRELYDQKIGTLAFTVNIPDSETIDLTSLDFVDGADSGTGSNLTFSQWDLTVSSGSVSPASGTDSLDGHVDYSSSSNDITLTGLTGLTDTSVTFTWTVNYGVTPDFSGSGKNSNRHAFLDDITLTGATGIPEPASLALLGLGGLLITRRRRRK